MQALTRRSLSSSSLAISNFLGIAHFSTQQYSSRRQEEDARGVRVSVWWDFENIHLPTAVSPYLVSNRITTALRANGITGPVQISAYGNVSVLKRPIQDAFSSTGINLVHVPAGWKNGADRLLMIDLLYWVSQHPPPAHLFLISGDSDFASILHKLRMSNYNILVANGEYVSTPLCRAASIVWQWSTLFNCENLIGRRFNQPPDGLFGSWYGNSRLPLESLYPSVEQTASLMGDGSSESESENALRPIPADVLGKICQILKSHPKGVSISVLCQELKNELVIDDDLYGYRKFSHFLLAMPEILTMHPLGDGQYWVRGINSNAYSSPSPNFSKRSSERSILDDSDHINLSTEMELHDGNLSRKLLKDWKPASDSPISSCDKEPQSRKLHQSFNSQTVQHSSPVTHVEEPSLMTEGQGPSNNDKDTIGVCVDNLVDIEKKNVSEDYSYFRRTWKRLFGGTDDHSLRSKESNPVRQTPPSLCSPSYDSIPAGTSQEFKACDRGSEDKSESYKGLKQTGFLVRITNWFMSDGYETGTVSEASSSEYHEHDIFLKNSFWECIKSFLVTPLGSHIISKSKSRLHIAQTMQNEGPAVLHSFKERDLLHLVDLLIDDKRWVEECTSRDTPFKIISMCGKIPPENLNKSTVSSSRLVREQQQADMHKLPKRVGENQKRASSGIYLLSDTKRSSEKTRNRMLGDCRKLLGDVVKLHPHGYHLRGFRKLFAERYNLNLEALGFETLVSLVKKIPGLTVEGAFVYSSKMPSEATSRPTMTDSCPDTIKDGHNVSDGARSGTLQNMELPV